MSQKNSESSLNSDQVDDAESGASTSTAPPKRKRQRKSRAKSAPTSAEGETPTKKPRARKERKRNSRAKSQPSQSSSQEDKSKGEKVSCTSVELENQCGEGGVVIRSAVYNRFNSLSGPTYIGTVVSEDNTATNVETDPLSADAPTSGSGNSNSEETNSSSSSRTDSGATSAEGVAETTSVPSTSGTVSAGAAGGSSRPNESAPSTSGTSSPETGSSAASEPGTSNSPSNFRERFNERNRRVVPLRHASELIVGQVYRIISVQRVNTRFGPSIRADIEDDRSAVGHSFLFLPSRFRDTSDDDIRQMNEAAATNSIFLIYRGRIELFNYVDYLEILRF